MTLAAQLKCELQAHVGQTHGNVTLRDGVRTLECQWDRCDQLAATVYSLRIDTPELASVEPTRLQEASQTLAARVNYLMEPIAPIEMDSIGCVVQMRSLPPRQEEQGRVYYELLLNRGGSLAMARYEKSPGAARTRIPAVLTHEVLMRLVEDFVATLESLARNEVSAP